MNDFESIIRIGKFALCETEHGELQLVDGNGNRRYLSYEDRNQLADELGQVLTKFWEAKWPKKSTSA